MRGLKTFYFCLSAFVILLCGANVGMMAACDEYKRENNILTDKVALLEGKVEGLERENHELINQQTHEPVIVVIPKEPEFELTEEEMRMIAGVVHAEAGNQDMIGRRLVADCILNRVERSKFPNTVAGVVYQEGQFSTPGSFTDADMAAVRMECQERLDREVLWFRTGGFHGHGLALYQHGAHYFSGEVEEGE